MPGISLVLKQFLDDEYKQIIFANIKNQNVLPNYTSTSLLNEKNIIIAKNIYNEYPVQMESRNNLTIIIEGKIYNKKKNLYLLEIFELFSELDESVNSLKIKNWLINTDGDFIIYVYNHTDSSISILNDVFGRLPLYYYSHKDEIIVSRYIKFIKNCKSKLNPDRMYLAQFMLLGYSLGTRTIIGQVDQLTSGSLLVFKYSQLKITKIFEFNFDHREHKDKKLDENIPKIAEHFSNACNNRFKNEKLNLLTLSGGLDSRLIASALNFDNIKFKSATIRYSYGSKVKDEEVAKQVSQLFRSDLTAVELKPPVGNDLFTLLKAKEGMNSLFTSQLLSFYEKIYNSFGSDINFITGDNGDRLIYSLNKPIKKMESLETLVDYIVNEHSIIDIKTVSNISGIVKDDIYNEIKNVLINFPEIEYRQKYVHLRTIEKPHKYAFQGEDRHRHYFWTLSPFWSFPFYNYLMNCSDKSKRKFILFAKLIEFYSKEAINIPYANFNASVDSLKGKLFLSMIYNIYPFVPTNLRGDFKAKFFGGNPNLNESSNLLRCLTKQIESNETINNYLNIKDFNELKSLRKVQLYNILTLTSAIEFYSTNNSSLLNYSDQEFI